MTRNWRVRYLTCRFPSLSLAGWRRRVFKSGRPKQSPEPAKLMKRSRIGKKSLWAFSSFLLHRCAHAVSLLGLFFCCFLRWVTCRTEGNRQETAPSRQPASDLIFSGSKKMATSNGLGSGWMFAALLACVYLHLFAEWQPACTKPRGSVSSQRASGKYGFCSRGVLFFVVEFVAGDVLVKYFNTRIISLTCIVF